MNNWESQIIESISKHDTESAIRFIQQGFPINYSIRYRDQSGIVQPGHSTLLIEGIQQNNLNFCKFLLESGINPNVIDSKGRHPAHLAATLGNLEILKLLIQYNCDLSTRDAIGNTVLHISSTNCHLEIVEYLIETLKFPVKVTNKLLEKPAQSCKALQDQGKTLASIEKLEEIIQYLWKQEIKSQESPIKKLSLYKRHQLCRGQNTENDSFPISIFPTSSKTYSISPFKARQSIQNYLKDKHAAIYKTLEDSLASINISQHSTRSPSPGIRLPKLKKKILSSLGYY